MMLRVRVSHLGFQSRERRFCCCLDDDDDKKDGL